MNLAQKKSYNQYIDSLNAYFSFIGSLRLCLSLQQKKRERGKKIETVQKDETLAQFHPGKYFLKYAFISN